MSQVTQEQPSMLARAEEIQRQIQQLSSRDLQLWSIVCLVILVLTGGLLALLAPNLMTVQQMLRMEQAYLPQLFFGLICLVVLFNIYLLSQRRALNSTRKALIGELVLNERLESLSLVDPLTQLLNRRALNELISHQLARANRSGEALTFLNIDINNFRELNAKLGNMEGNRVLVEFSKLDKDLRVKDGKVLAHASNKEDIYKALLQTRGKNVSIEYCGELPQDLVVMFCSKLHVDAHWASLDRESRCYRSSRHKSHQPRREF